MLNFLVDLVGSTVSALFGDVFERILRGLDRSRFWVALVLLVAAGCCVTGVYSQTGSILGVVPVTLGVLGLVAVFLIARRYVAGLPDPPAPPAALVVTPLPEPETVAAINVDLPATRGLSPGLGRRVFWFHLACALAGLAGQMVMYWLGVTGTTQSDLMVQLICGGPFGLAAGLIVSRILAPSAEIDKAEWLEQSSHWVVGLAVSFIVGLVISIPVFLFVTIVGSA